MKLPRWKLKARQLYWQGKSVKQIANILWRTQNQVRGALFVTVLP